MLQGGAQGLLIRKDKDMGQLLEAWSLIEYSICPRPLHQQSKLPKCGPYEGNKYQAFWKHLNSNIPLKTDWNQTGNLLNKRGLIQSQDL